MSCKANPWEVIALRRKIKNYEKYGYGEGMKNLSKLRGMGLDKKMLVATEVTRTLVWASVRTKEFGEDEEKRKFNKMLRFLIKEYKAVLGIVEKKEAE